MVIYNLELTPVNVLFMFDVLLHRFWFRVTRNLNPSSEPFISGDTFRTLAKHVWDADSKFDPKLVEEGDIVFVGSELLDEFFEFVNLKIAHPYKLISHNGDKNIDKKYLKYLDKKIIRWYGQNVKITHPKLTPIPIGLENLDHYNHGVPTFLKTKIQPKFNRILYGFSVSTNPKVRVPVLSICKQLDCADEVLGRLNSKRYLSILSRYKFVVSPEGNGLDCHRTWEALYLGVVPIVQDNAAHRSFEDLGLPIWIVKDWNDLSGLSSRELEQKYEQLRDRFDSKVLSFKYWQDRIEQGI